MGFVGVSVVTCRWPTWTRCGAVLRHLAQAETRILLAGASRLSFWGGLSTRLNLFQKPIVQRNLLVLEIRDFLGRVSIYQKRDGSHTLQRFGSRLGRIICKGGRTRRILMASAALDQNLNCTNAREKSPGWPPACFTEPPGVK
jgi:hypothetical protein